LSQTEMDDLALPATLAQTVNEGDYTAGSDTRWQGCHSRSRRCHNGSVATDAVAMTADCGWL
jgi:hypothetical protein